MSYWWIVDADPESPTYMNLLMGGDNNFKEHCRHDKSHLLLEVPEGVAPGNVVVEEDNGVLSLVESAEKIGPKWNALRAERSLKLLSCDWTQLADSPLSPENKDAWAVYRQELRDLPQETLDPDNVVWPEEP